MINLITEPAAAGKEDLFNGWPRGSGVKGARHLCRARLE